MIVSVIVAAAVFALLSLPGWLLAADRARAVWFYVAAGFASQFAIVLATALISLVVPGQIDVRWTIAVAIGGATLVLAFRRPTARPLLETLDGWAFVVPTLAVIAAAAITRGAISHDAEGLVVHAWFNADGFKHLGHVQSLARFGLPAQDIFAADGPLAYYWFFYVIPATGAALHGDAAEALVGAGLIQTFAFWIVVHGLLRSAGANPRWAALLAAIAWLSPSPDGIVALAWSDFDFWRAATEVNNEAMNGGAMNGCLLFRAGLYIPQHQWMLAGLMSWSIFHVAPADRVTPSLRRLALSPLVCAGAASTLFGAACLCIYALTRALDQRATRLRRGAEIAVVGLVALAVPVLFAIVGPYAGHSGLDSPVFAAPEFELSRIQRLVNSIPGLVLLYGVSLIGLFGLRERWRQRQEDGRPILAFAGALIVAGMLLLIASTLSDNRRLAQEFQLRVSLLPLLGLTIATAWLLVRDGEGQWLPRRWVLLASPLLALGLMTPVLDTIWHMRSIAHWRVRVPQDDLALLAYVDRHAPRDAIVLQYPEIPYVSGGRDLWTPILAGRRIYGSMRATNWQAAKPKVDKALAWFDEGAPLPDGQYDYIYLSRALHPASFDTLTARLRGTGQWQEVFARPDANLWQRR